MHTFSIVFQIICYCYIEQLLCFDNAGFQVKFNLIRCKHDELLININPTKLIAYYYIFTYTIYLFWKRGITRFSTINFQTQKYVIIKSNDIYTQISQVTIVPGHEQFQWGTHGRRQSSRRACLRGRTPTGPCCVRMCVCVWVWARARVYVSERNAERYERTARRTVRDCVWRLYAPRASATPPAPRTLPPSPRSTLNRRIKNLNFFVRIRFFSALSEFFSRDLSPLFRLPEMNFFRFRRMDRARCAFKSCLIFLGKGNDGFG